MPGNTIDDWAQPIFQSSAVLALTDVVTSDVGAIVRAISQQAHRVDGLVSLMGLIAAREVAMLHDHIVRLGRQTAYERMSHLMPELQARLQLAGMAVGDTFLMPLSPETLADSLGLSVIHVNRTLTQMRRDEVMELQTGRVRIIDLKMMQQLADWRSSWLYASSLPVFGRS